LILSSRVFAQYRLVQKIPLESVSALKDISCLLLLATFIAISLFATEAALIRHVTGAGLGKC
jgi:hypothetical protein